MPAAASGSRDADGPEQAAGDAEAAAAPGDAEAADVPEAGFSAALKQLRADRIPPGRPADHRSDPTKGRSMTTENVPLSKPAGDLKPGDRIATGFLPGSLSAADVLFAYPYTGRDGLAWVFLAYRESGYGPESERFLSGSQIPVESVADTGLAYSRELESTVVAPVPADVEGHPEFGRQAPAPGVVAVGDGHVVHECCGVLDDVPHQNFCGVYIRPAGEAS